MGDFADDLRDNFDQEYPDMEPVIWVPLENAKVHNVSRREAEYEVSIIHRTTGMVVWTGSVNAYSKKDAQRQFRIDHAKVRAQYTHEYGLGIKLKK